MQANRGAAFKRETQHKFTTRRRPSRNPIQRIIIIVVSNASPLPVSQPPGKLQLGDDYDVHAHVLPL